MWRPRSTAASRSIRGYLVCMNGLEDEDAGSRSFGSMGKLYSRSNQRCHCVYSLIDLIVLISHDISTRSFHEAKSQNSAGGIIR